MIDIKTILKPKSNGGTTVVRGINTSGGAAGEVKRAAHADIAELARKLDPDSDDWKRVQEIAEQYGSGRIDEEELRRMLAEIGGEMFLSKTDDDEAAGNIGFLEGLWVGARDWFFDKTGRLRASVAEIVGKLTADSAEVAGDVTVGGDLHTNGFTYADLGVRTNEVRSDDYTGDTITGTGFLLTNNNNGHSKLTIDEIYVRMKAVFESLEVKRWEASAGDEVRSCASSVVTRVDYFSDTSPNPLGYSYVRVPWLLKGVPFLLRRLTYGTALERWMYSRMVKTRVMLTDDQLLDVRWCRCYFPAKDGETTTLNWWRTNDLARCQTMNISSTTRETYIKSIERKQGNVFWWRKVIGVSTQPVELEQGKSYHYFDVAFNYVEEQRQSASVYCMLGSDIPAAGDHVVQFGNTVEPGRMNLMMTEVNGGNGLFYNPDSDAPCIKAYRGIYTFDLTKCWFGGNPCKMKLSPSSGFEFHGPSFTFVEEHGSVPAMVQRGDWAKIAFEQDDWGRTVAYSDDATSGRTGTQVRKCYYYDEVSHKGRTWLCSINNHEPHWVAEQTFSYRGTTYQAGRYISDGSYTALSEELKVLCTRKEAYTTEEPSPTARDWTMMVDRGTSVKTVETRYAKKGPAEEGAGTEPPTLAWDRWKPMSQLDELNLQNGDYLWSCTRTEYSDTLPVSYTYSVSRWGIDGDGISSINSYYLGTDNVTLAITANNDTYKMPGQSGWGSADRKQKWFDTFADMAAANDGVGQMQGWNVWQKTVIHYDLPTGKTGARKPDIIQYTCSRLGIDGLMGQEEYYCLRESDQYDEAFGGTTYAKCGIRWKNPSNPGYDNYQLSDTTPNINTQMWNAEMPEYDESKPTFKYLWNFEQRADGQGTEFATKPICIGNHARGIKGVIELYALSASQTPISESRPIPTDINNKNTWGVIPTSGFNDKQVWGDEKYDRAPTETLPYQWNWTRTLYSAADENGLTYEDHYHVSAVRGTRGEDGSGVEYIYKLTNSETAPSTPASSDSDKEHDDYIPSGWTDNPQGVSLNNQFEWVCERHSTATKGTGGFTGGHVWGDFSAPKMWSKWGKNGQDGDGMEYVFVRTANNTAPTITNSSDTYQSKTYLDDDYLPLSSAGRCTDDPQGVSRQLPYEWVAKRTKGSPATTGSAQGARSWEKYSGTMALWANYTESNIRLDIDNEMDMVQTDSTRKVTEARTVSTIVHFYDGAHEIAIGNALEMSGNPGSSIARFSNDPSGSYARKLSWSFYKDVTIPSAYDITLSFTYNNLTYTARFTIAASMGQAIYQLKPSLAVIAFSRQSNNTLTPSSRTLGMVVVKHDKGSTQELTVANSGMKVVYSTSEMPATKDGGTDWPSSGVTVNSSASYGNVFVAMFNSSGVLIDRETIPIMKDGENGSNADTTVFAYQWNQSPTSGPTKPSTGQWGSWSKTAPNRPGDGYFLWMIQATKSTAKNGTVTYSEWSTQVRISGDTGSAGEDASDIEWIYTRNNTGTTPSTPSNPSDRTADDYVPSGWTDNPKGVNYSYQYEYASYRQKPSGKNQTWGDFQTPVLWSHWGTNGMDGDGMEYVYMRTTKNVAPQISSSQSGYTSDEFLPSITNQSSCGAESGKCTDDPKGVSETYPYEWVAKRTMTSPNAQTGKRSWNIFPSGNMELWAKFGKDGVDGDDGDDAVVYALTPSPTAVNFQRDATGAYIQSTITVTCGYRKFVGSVLAEDVASGNAETSSPYVYYRCQNADGTYRAWVKAAAITPSNSVTDRLIQFCLSTASSTTGVADSNILAKVDVPVLHDGARGVQGSTGRIAYPAGEWSAQTYTRTATATPVVHRKVSGSDTEYWYLDADSASSTDVPSTSSTKWKPATKFGMVITDMMFTMFAKLGGFVVAGDFFISQYGTLVNSSGVETAVNMSNATTLYPSTGSDRRVPYAWFDGSDPMATDSLPASGKYKFRPMKVINAVTGEEWMAQGNVHVDSNGDVTMIGTVEAKTIKKPFRICMTKVYISRDTYIHLMPKAFYAYGDYEGDNDETSNNWFKHYTIVNTGYENSMPSVLSLLSDGQAPTATRRVCTLIIYTKLPHPSKFRGHEVEIVCPYSKYNARIYIEGYYTEDVSQSSNKNRLCDTFGNTVNQVRMNSYGTTDNRPTEAGGVCRLRIVSADLGNMGTGVTGDNWVIIESENCIIT